MQYVRDANGLEWIIDLNLGCADELDAFVRDAYSVDLFDSVQVMTLLARPTNVVSVASCICREQREQRNMSPEEFGRGWKGESAYKLQQALWKEYGEFFPNPTIAALINSTREHLQSLNESESELVRKAMGQLEETMEKAVSEMQSIIDAE